MKIDDFLQLENKYNLLNIQIDGVKVWRYVRVTIWNFMICTKKFDLSNPVGVGTQKKFQGISNIWLLIKNSINSLKIRKIHYDICFLDHSRRLKIDEYYTCIYTEKLSEIFKNSITLESPFGYKHFKPIKNKNVLYVDYPKLIVEVLYTINVKLHTKYYKHLREKIITQFEVVLDELISTYGIELNKEKIYDELTRAVIVVKVQRPYYKRLLKKISPRLIVEVVHYSLKCMLINELAHGMGIKTIELQHGTIYPEHLAYQYKRNEKIEQLPDYLFTFSSYWHEIINLPQKSTKIISTGFPFFEEQLIQYNKTNNIISSKINILFISQGTVAKQLIELALLLNSKIDKRKYTIIYKFHPSEYTGWETRYSDLQASDIVIPGQNIGLYELFAKSRIQIGVYSTAIYEGVGFGLDTYIYNIAYADCMQKLVEMGVAEYVNSAEEILCKLDIEKKTKDIKSLLWKSNALENICKEINYLLSI